MKMKMKILKKAIIIRIERRDHFASEIEGREICQVIRLAISLCSLRKTVSFLYSSAKKQ